VLAVRKYAAEQGANICGPPALDHQYKTSDFLTLLDLETMPSLARQNFWPHESQAV